MTNFAGIPRDARWRRQPVPWRALAAGVALQVAAAVAAAAQSAPSAGPARGPQIPKSGTIARDAAREAGVLEQFSVPDGFTMTLFAAPPVAMYPTVVAPAADGSVYVGVDLNLAQGAVPGRGRIMRLVDDDGDGRADRYTIFTDVDSPRGIVVDGNTVYVLHVPTLEAFRDTNGDGIADERKVLVRNLGFGIDVRSSDHSTNNITMGLDGWIYVAVGDYGFLKATGTDGRTITNRGGAVVRVRPDGTGLEQYSRGSRNMYDIAIDPFGRVFGRDNTNDGDGWDTRLHYIPANADMGYPSLYKHFATEHMRSLFDYGAGSGTAGLWLQDPGFPDEWNNTLYTGDWTIQKLFRHRLTPKGASFTIDQTDFMSAPRLIDVTMDDQSRLYVASLVGGVFNYAGDTVGAIVQVRYPGRPASAALHPEQATIAALVNGVLSANATHRLWAQRELLRRKPSAPALAPLVAAIAQRDRPADARAAALFTLHLMQGAASRPTITRAIADPALRGVALRVLADDITPVRGLDPAPFVAALRDADPFVRTHGINGLVRTASKAQARALAPLLADSDSTISHLAARALASLGARDVALQALLTGPAAGRARARGALGLMHDTATVRAVAAALTPSVAPAVQEELLLTLARLANREAPWNGDWWGTRPNFTGPYFQPVAWEGTPIIRPVLRNAFVAANGPAADSLTAAFMRNRVLPLGSKALLTASGAMRTAIIDALIGSATIPATAVPLLTRIGSAGGAMRVATAEAIAGETGVVKELVPLTASLLGDSALSAEVRGRVLGAAAQARTEAEIPQALALLAKAIPTVSAGAPAAAPAAGAGAGGRGGAAAAPDASPVETAWRRFIGARERTQQLDAIIAVAKGGTADERVVAYAILTQAVRNPRAAETVRDKVLPVVTAAWTDANATPHLVRAIRVMRLESLYPTQLEAYNARR